MPTRKVPIRKPEPKPRTKKATTPAKVAEPDALDLAKNLETVARTITERTLARLAGPGAHLAPLVEAHWQTTARELRAGLMDAQGNILTSRFISNRIPPEGSKASGRSRSHAARVAHAAPKE